MGWVRSRGDTARGIVGGRDLGFAHSVSTTGHVGGEFGGGQQEGISDASGLSDEGDDKKCDPVEENGKPAEPSKGLEGLVLLAEADSGGWCGLISVE